MTEQVQAYLDNHAKQDAVFAEKMRNPRKTIKNCMAYIAQKAREYMEKHKDEFNKCDASNGYTMCGDIDDNICYGWANHYYDEDGLEIDMTDEERKAKREQEAAERKAKAEAAKEEAKQKAKEAKKAAKAEAKAAAPAPKAEQKPKEKKLTKSELRKGADCYSLFDF